MLLVDDGDDYAILEQLIEETKPEFPPGVPAEPAYFLLTSPFRYQAARYESRFRALGETAHVLYAAENEMTALLEFTSYRLRFYLDSDDGLPTGMISSIAFSFQAKHEQAIDLHLPPYADNPAYTDKDDYTACQEIAEVARSMDVGIILYESVRDPEKGCNAALLSWDAIDQNQALTMGRILKLFFKKDQVIVQSGPRGETQSLSYDQLLNG